MVAGKFRQLLIRLQERSCNQLVHLVPLHCRNVPAVAWAGAGKFLRPFGEIALWHGRSVTGDRRVAQEVDSFGVPKNTVIGVVDLRRLS